MAAGVIREGQGYSRQRLTLLMLRRPHCTSCRGAGAGYKNFRILAMRACSLDIYDMQHNRSNVLNIQLSISNSVSSLFVPVNL